MKHKKNYLLVLLEIITLAIALVLLFLIVVQLKVLLNWSEIDSTVNMELVQNAEAFFMNILLLKYIVFKPVYWGIIGILFLCLVLMLAPINSAKFNIVLY